MIQTIVRAKTGLHAGATWRFDQASVVIGSSAQANVFLCDPDIPEHMLILKRRGRKYCLELLNDQAEVVTSDQTMVEGVIFPGQSALLTFRHVQLEIQVLRSGFGVLTSFVDHLSRVAHLTAAFLRRLGAKAIVALLFTVSLATTTMVLFFGTAGVAKSEAIEAKASTPPPQLETKATPAEILASRFTEQVVNELRVFEASSQLNNFDLIVEGAQVKLSAEMSRSQTRSFEKLLTRLGRDYGDRTQITAEVRLSEQQRLIDELDVAQVVLGSKPVVIMRDGQSLYEGGLYEGLRIERIQSDRVVLKGDAIYEIAL